MIYEGNIPLHLLCRNNGIKNHTLVDSIITESTFMNKIRSIGLCFAIIFFALYSSEINGQNQVPYINSFDTISLGIAYNDTGAYAQASTLYEKVSENDTNYALALIEDAIAKESGEQDSAAIIICRKGIEQKSEYTSDFYNTLANIYIDEGNYEDAITLLKDTIFPKYPNIHTLYFTLGLAQYKMHNYADAINSFEKAIDLDTYDAVSHYYLGRCCLEQGRLIPALLSFQFYLMLQPDKNRSYTVVGLIEQMTGNKYQYNKSYSVDPSKYHDSAFTELDLLIRSKIAMNAQYKSSTTINYTFAKQIQLLLEQLKYIPNTGNYWMEKYVPFFTGLQQKKYLEPYLYFIMASVTSNDPNLQKGVVKNKKKIEKFAQWADGQLTAARGKKEMEVNGKKILVNCHYWDNDMVEAVGPENSVGKDTGEWIHYYRHTGSLYSKGKYNNNGEREGKWQWFYNSGALKETDNFIKGKREDTAKLWYENGAPKAIYIFHDDLFNGDCMEYNVSGILTSKTIYSDNKLSGPATYFYDDGKTHYFANYTNGKFEKELKEYYVTGQIMSIKAMQNDFKNGAYISYFTNGKIQETGEYKDDKQIGNWKTYYKDGNLQKEGNFNMKGEPEGKWVLYFRNGKKEETESFNKNGNLDGMDSLFDDDGILYETETFKNDMLLNYTFKDKDGYNVTTGKLNGNHLSMINYSPAAAKKSEGLYIDNKKEGEWRYYNDYGDLETRENFYSGNLYGVTANYYSNGKLKDSTNYTDGEKDGYYASYFINGQMDTQGWYLNDIKQGDWYYYDLKGHLVKHIFFVNGNLHGRIDFYEANGSLSEQHFYKYGYLDRIFLYDSTGSKIIYKYISDKGNGKYLLTYTNGNIAHELNYMNGSLDGPDKRYFYNGNLSEKNNYLLDKLQDTLKAFYEKGNLKYIYNYDMGDCQGIGKSYYKNGKLEQIGTYYNGDLDGDYTHYNDDGKVDILAHYNGGKLDKEYKVCYGETNVAAIFRTNDGTILGYSSVDKTGKPLQRINLEKGTGNVICYYPNGNKSIQCIYAHGELAGKDLTYSPDGKLAAERNYESGYLNGIQKYYYEGDTTLKETDNYYYGQLDGPCRYYYKNGKLEHEESYSLGMKEGPSRYYDEQGKLIKTVFYFYGNETTETVSR